MMAGVLATDSGLNELCCAGVHDPDEAEDLDEFVFLPDGTV